MITWSRPVHYDNITYHELANDSKIDLYMITGKYSNRRSKIFYIGKTYYQTVAKRLSQQDHADRIRYLKKKHPNHRLFISCGRVEITNGKRAASRLDEIESILIFSVDTESKINLNKNYTLSTKSNHYIIKNKGYRGELKKRLYFGLFYGG